LDNALVIDAVDLPGFRLHALRGELHGYWAVTVRGNWRVIFRFENGQALDVDLVDYH
jgi:proteic killer suppression protein